MSTLIIATKHPQVIKSFYDVRFLKTIYTFSTQNNVNIEIVEISHIVLKNSLIGNCLKKSHYESDQLKKVSAIRNVQLLSPYRSNNLRRFQVVNEIF